MFYTIYQITHVPSGNIYIGKHQTTNLDDNYMGSGKRLKRAQEKHGLDQFEKTILHVFDNEEDMNAKEAELVTEDFCSRFDTYNICPGGKGGWGYVNQNGLRDIGHTNEMYLKVSATMAGRPCHVNTKTAVKAAHEADKYIYNTYGMLGKNHTAEAKTKMSEAKTGSKNSQFGTMWITNGIENRKIKKNDPIPEGWNKGRRIYG